jgi:hypothetical protein
MIGFYCSNDAVDECAYRHKCQEECQDQTKKTDTDENQWRGDESNNNSQDGSTEEEHQLKMIA